MKLYKDVLRIIFRQASKMGLKTATSVRNVCKWTREDTEIYKEWCKYPRKIRQRNVHDGLVTLDVPGCHYNLVEDLTTSIVIKGDNIFLTGYETKIPFREREINSTRKAAIIIMGENIIIGTIHVDCKGSNSIVGSVNKKCYKCYMCKCRTHWNGWRGTWVSKASEKDLSYYLELNQFEQKKRLKQRLKNMRETRTSYQSNDPNTKEITSGRQQKRIFKQKLKNNRNRGRY